ncbi:hypothetical protein [Hymenobacter weizhouensis]|uniref:hypothetical protein n=1 Tax=Hymenobacter sp. YIM 151500-1 TaxID=2987689 RepID=UPI0022271F05|nr:hypothetical protein [Hymenobacter sp. YIM 151500-1]UYZ61569.1 hypothetical protein OIS53_11180 [Hymenobacter sp. YIM 151500-1]
MNKLHLLYSAALASTLLACSSPDSATTNAAAPASGSEAAAPAAGTAPLDVSTWQPTDLSKLVPELPITLNLPAGVKMEKNGNGGIDIQLSDKSLLTASFPAVSSVKEAMATDEDYYIKNDMYQDARKVVDEPHGFVYTRRMKPEQNGTTYEPESHFVYYLEGKDGAIYQLAEDRTMDGMSNAKGSDYPERRAKELYEAVKKSAKLTK